MVYRFTISHLYLCAYNCLLLYIIDFYWLLLVIIGYLYMSHVWSRFIQHGNIGAELCGPSQNRGGDNRRKMVDSINKKAVEWKVMVTPAPCKQPWVSEQLPFTLVFRVTWTCKIEMMDTPKETWLPGAGTGPLALQKVSWLKHSMHCFQAYPYLPRV